MLHVPFTSTHFQLMASAKANSSLPELETQINELRGALGHFPEFRLDFYRLRLARRPRMRGKDGLVFGRARWVYDGHWFLFDVGGDQNQVQLNIGMFPSHIRVGMGFMSGRQVAPKPPAFQVFQAFLGMRPPLPFRNAFRECVREHRLRIESDGKVEEVTDAEAIVDRLETYHVPAGDAPHFVFIGHIWTPREAETKDVAAYREALRVLLPFYEELVTAGGRYEFFV